MKQSLLQLVLLFTSYFVLLVTPALAQSYCPATGNGMYERIAQVKINGLINNSSSTAGYENFNSFQIPLQRGFQHSLTLTPGYSSGAFYEYWAMYIDYNHNGNFVDPGEVVYKPALNAQSAVSGTFTVPSTALLGATRIRIVMSYVGSQLNSCPALSYGQTEDYTAIISDGSPTPTPTVIASPTPTSMPTTTPTSMPTTTPTWTPTSTPTTMPTTTPVTSPTPSPTQVGSAMNIPVYVSSNNIAQTFVWNRSTHQIAKASQTAIPLPAARTELGNATGIAEVIWRNNGLSDLGVYNGFLKGHLSIYQGNTAGWRANSYSATGLDGWYSWNGRLAGRGGTVFLSDTGLDSTTIGANDAAIRSFDLKDGAVKNWFPGRAFRYIRLGADGYIYAIEQSTTQQPTIRFLKIDPNTMTEVQQISPIYQTNAISAARNGDVFIAGPRGGGTGVYLQRIPAGSSNLADGAWLPISNVVDMDISEDDQILVTSTSGQIYIADFTASAINSGYVRNVGTGMTFAAFGRPLSTLSYCDSVGAQTSFERIESVSIYPGGTVVPSDEKMFKSYSLMGSEDFRRYPLAKVQAGKALAIRVVPVGSGFLYPEYHSVYVDWNRDGDFTDSGEYALSTSQPVVGEMKGSFNVPAGVQPGSVTMRVILHYGASHRGPCNFAGTNYSTYYGQVEDYSLAVIP